MNDIREKRSIVENAMCDLCVDLFQRYVISQDESDLNNYFKAYDRLPQEKRKEVLKSITKNIRDLKLAEPYEESKIR